MREWETQESAETSPSQPPRVPWLASLLADFRVLGLYFLGGTADTRGMETNATPVLHAAHWIDTARKVAANGYCYVDRSTGCELGKGRQQVLQRDYEANDEAGGNEGDLPASPKRLRSGKRLLLDSFTASMLVQITDALNETNRAKFLALPFLKAISVGWKLVGKSQEVRS